MPVDVADSIRATYARTLLLAVSGERVDLTSLQTLVCDYVRRAKELGEPPQRVIVALKQLMVANLDRYEHPEQQQNLRESILKWCLDEYYGPESATETRSENATPVYRAPGLSD